MCAPRQGEKMRGDVAGRTMRHQNQNTCDPAARLENRFQKQLGQSVVWLRNGLAAADGWWAARPRRTRLALAFVLPVTIGAVLRLWHYFGARSLWIDEAYIALNFLERDLGALFGQLDYHQVAPLGWLVLEDWLLSTFGGLELTLRLPSLVAGLAALVLFSFVARRYLSFGGAVFAVLFFALSNVLVRYSAEIKPYMLDVLFSVIVVWIGYFVFEAQRRLGIRDHFLLFLFGLVAVPLSFPAAFLLGGLGGLMIVCALLLRHFRQAVALAAMAGAWLVEFGLMFFVIRREQVGTVSDMQERMLNFSFAPLPPTSLRDLAWYPEMLVHYLDFVFEFQAVVFAFVILVAGVAVAFRKNFWLALFLVSPAVLLIAASALETYPVYHRLLLFLLPQTILLTAMGLEGIGAALKTDLLKRLVPVALGAVLLSSLVFVTAKHFADPQSPPYADEHIRPALDYIAQNRQSGDALYVYYAAYPAFEVYRDRTDLGDMAVMKGSSPRISWNCYFRDFARMRPRGRVWIVMSHITRLSGMDEEKGFKSLADQFGDKRDARRFGMRTKLYGQATVYLYDFSGPKSALPDLALALPDNPDQSCLHRKSISAW